MQIQKSKYLRAPTASDHFSPIKIYFPQESSKSRQAKALNKLFKQFVFNALQRFPTLCPNRPTSAVLGRLPPSMRWLEGFNRLTTWKHTFAAVYQTDASSPDCNSQIPAAHAGRPASRRAVRPWRQHRSGQLVRCGRKIEVLCRQATGVVSDQA